MGNEHDDDLEAVVDDAAEIEAEIYPNADDLEAERGADVITTPGGLDAPAPEIDKEENDEQAGDWL